MPRCGQSGACQRFRAVNRRFDRLLLAPGAILSLPKPVKGRFSSRNRRESGGCPLKCEGDHSVQIMRRSILHHPI
jgi:hypothetical protein